MKRIHPRERRGAGVYASASVRLLRMLPDRKTSSPTPLVYGMVLVHITLFDLEVPRKLIRKELEDPRQECGSSTV
jgi:hypothetical protein